MRRYASCRYVQSHYFDESVNSPPDWAFVNRFQEFAFDVDDPDDKVILIHSFIRS